MTKKVSIISNLSIAAVLLVLSLAIFTTNLAGIYTTVAAPLYNGNKNEKNVSIMFSIAGATSGANLSTYIDSVTNILSEKGVGATFFVSGIWAMQNPEQLKMLGTNYELGNSGYSAKDFKNLSAANQKSEISGAHEAVYKLTGIEMKLFSPPSGSFSKTTLKTASGLGYTTVLWNKDTFDWRDSDAELITQRATQNLKNGDIVLMTPTASTVEALPSIIDFYLSQGFNVVAVGKNIM